MKKLFVLLLLLILLPLSLLAVNLSYTSFDGTQFVTNGTSLPISIKNGALATNITFVGPLNIVDPSNTNNAVFQYVPGLSQITLNNQGLISGGTITAAHFIGEGAGISNVIARGPFTNMTIWASNNGPAITIAGVTNGNPQLIMRYNTTNGVSDWTWKHQAAYFQGHNDEVTLMGYGIDNLAGQQLCYDQWEPYYWTGAAAYQCERWMGCSGTNLTQLRPFMYTCDKDAYVQEMLAAEDVIIYTDSTRATVGVESKNANFTVNEVTTIQSTNLGTLNVTGTNNAAGWTMTSDFGVGNKTGGAWIESKTNGLFAIGTRPGDLVLQGSRLVGNFGGASIVWDSAFGLTNLGNIFNSGTLTNNGAMRVNGLLYGNGAGIFASTLNCTGGFTNQSGTSMFGGATTVSSANAHITLGTAGGTTTPCTLFLQDAMTTAPGAPAIVFNGNGAAGYGIGTEASADGIRIGHVTSSGYSTGVVRTWPTSGFTHPIDLSGVVNAWNGETVSNSLTVVTGQFNGNGAGLTNIPPASITGRSYVQTNFVLNTVYAASIGSFTTVAGTAIITAAAAVGNVELDVMYQAGGSGAYTAISAPSLTTTVLSIVMPYQIPFSATITNGNFYLTNATTTAGGSASLKSGTGTLTTF